MKNKLIKIGSIVAVVIVLLTMTVVPTFAASEVPYRTIDYSLELPSSSTALVKGKNGTFATVSGGKGSGDTIRHISDDPSSEMFCEPYYTTALGRYWQIDITIPKQDLTNSELKVYPALEVPLSNTCTLTTFKFSNTSSQTHYSDVYNGFYYKFTFSGTYRVDAPTVTVSVFLLLDNVGNEHYDIGYDDGYEIGLSHGFQNGLNASDSSALGENLLGSTLKAPVEALNQFVLFESSGVSVTLGGVVGAVIALSLFLLFLKMFH